MFGISNQKIISGGSKPSTKGWRYTTTSIKTINGTHSNDRSSIKKGNTMNHPNFNKKEGDWMLDKDRKERAYHEKRWKEQEKKKRAKKKLVHDEKTRAIVQDPHFLVMTVKEVQETEGIAGEEDTIIALILIANTRLINNASAESKNLLLSDTTGTGKDRVTKATLKVLLPDDMHFHFSKMTPEAFTYFHANEPDWTWDDKVIHFEDITQQLLNTSTFKVMASGEAKAAVVKDQKTIELEVNGKPVMIVTSHHTNPNDENLRRFPIGRLNDTQEQTQRIKRKIAQRYSPQEKREPNASLRKALRLLQPHEVIIPYADIPSFFFPDTIIMRTHFERFLCYICSSAVFHQYQREKTPDGKLIAKADDYMIARMLLLYTTQNPNMIPVSKDLQDILDILRDNISPLRVKDILEDPRCNKSQDWFYKNLPKLVETGLLTREKIDMEAGAVSRGVWHYQYAQDLQAKAIPTWNELSGQLIEALLTNNDNGRKEIRNILDWFYENNGTIGTDKEGRHYLVLLPKIIPIYREVTEVFEVLFDFLMKRNSGRYIQYVDDSDLRGGTKPRLQPRIIEDENVEFQDTKPDTQTNETDDEDEDW
jgi:predicted transcriptional regulator